ncbi:hypothetical protein GCM10010236_09730 [Streptomyces eurythermus]|nr:hypothetical protein GCM10010236_09730 [Streptomyces eurythermus]
MAAVSGGRGRWLVGPEVWERSGRCTSGVCAGRASRERLVHQYVREVFPNREVRVSHRTTLARVWREWFGPGGARQR